MNLNSDNISDNDLFKFAKYLQEHSDLHNKMEKIWGNAEEKKSSIAEFLESLDTLYLPGDIKSTIGQFYKNHLEENEKDLKKAEASTKLTECMEKAKDDPKQLKSCTKTYKDTIAGGKRKSAKGKKSKRKNRKGRKSKKFYFF